MLAMIKNLFKPKQRTAPHWADAELARRQARLRERQSPMGERRAEAIFYLRSGGKYCLDQPVSRTSPSENLTFLERWKRDHARG